MLSSKLKASIFLFLTLFFASCGGSSYGGGSSDYNPPQSENVAPPVSFSTRLSSTLLIAGDKCLGGETSQNNGQVITCNAGQYLVTIDNINTCDSAGRCTQVGVFPIIGNS